MLGDVRRAAAITGALAAAERPAVSAVMVQKRLPKRDIGFSFRGRKKERSPDVRMGGFSA
jgi:hypothetical protein